MSMNSPQDEPNSNVRAFDRRYSTDKMDQPVIEEFTETDEFDRPLWMPELQLFTVIEVAYLLNIGRSKVYELMYKGELRSVKIGGSRRIRYSDLGEYVRYLDDAS